MTSTATFQAGGAASLPGPGEFEYRRFDCYRVALEFQAMVPRLFPRRGFSSLRDQLDRASASILLNIAEGWCDQRRLAHSGGVSPPGVEARSPVAWMADRRETD